MGPWGFTMENGIYQLSFTPPRLGEVGRHAVHCSIARQFDDVVADYHIVDQILGQLAKVTLRNKSGANDDLRRKFDQIKWTLKKVEQLVYDISFQKAHGSSATEEIS